MGKTFENIRLVARYERRLITRGKLFWIFTICVLVGITVFQWGWQGGGGWRYNPWSEVALPSYIPYLNAWLYSLVQGVMIVFVGVDFIRRDRRLETNVVFLARPVTNTEYQTGKVVGILEICMLLNVLTVACGMAIHLLFGEEGTFQPEIYLIYMFVLTIPSLIFVLGLGLIVVNQFKNYALAILILLGGLGAFYFGVPEVLWGVFDPWGRALPLLFSDITGMVHPGWTALQRGVFVMSGIGLTMLAMGMMKQLSDRGILIRIVQWTGAFFILAGVFLGILYVEKFREINTRREAYREMFRKYAGVDNVHVKEHDIRFRQEGERMFATSRLILENERAHGMKECVLYLNPGLRVTALKDREGNTVPFIREEQMVVVDRELAPGEVMNLSMEYEGIIDEAVCYPDFSDEEFHDTRLVLLTREVHSFYRHGGCYARVGNDYTFLIPECLWYPVSVPPVNMASPLVYRYDFTRYALQVENVGERTVISQGSMEIRDNTARFENENPLPRLSLSIGDYVKKSILLDSLQLEIYHFPGHDFFLQDYTTGEDSLKMLIESPVSQVWEHKGNGYLYHRFAVVETPVNFKSFQRKGSMGSEFIVPEMIFVPEKLYYALYFRVKYWIWKSAERSRFEWEQSVLRNMMNFTLQDGPFNCAVLFQDFGGFVMSDEYPGVGGIINHLLRPEMMHRGPMIYFDEDMQYEEVVDYWSNKSLREFFEDREVELNNLRILSNKKYGQIERHLRALVGGRELLDFAKDFKKRYAFAGTNLDVFAREFQVRFGLNIHDVLDMYYEMKTLPVLFVRDMKVEQLEGEEYEEKIASCKVYNPSSVDGVVTLLERNYSGEDGYSSDKRNILIPARACKEIRVVLASDVYFFLDLNLCQNIPGNCVLEFGSGSLEKTRNGNTGVWDTDSSVFLKKEAGIIEDDDSDGFVVHEKKKREKLAAYFSKKTEHKKYDYIYDHEHWTLVTNSECYGDIVKSAYYKVAGTGKSKVEWKVKIEEPGKYDVQVYVPDITPTPARGTFIKGARLFYQVVSSEGSTDVEIILENEEPGWISLGKFDFDTGNYSVFLSDQGGDSLSWEKTEDYSWEDKAVQLIVADAVRWIPVKR